VAAESVADRQGEEADPLERRLMVLTPPTSPPFITSGTVQPSRWWHSH
jgi:hypothetical protein